MFGKGDGMIKDTVYQARAPDNGTSYKITIEYRML